jgi:hypothetical protein
MHGADWLNARRAMPYILNTPFSAGLVMFYPNSRTASETSSVAEDGVVREPKSSSPASSSAPATPRSPLPQGHPHIVVVAHLRTLGYPEALAVGEYRAVEAANGLRPLRHGT